LARLPGGLDTLTDVELCEAIWLMSDGEVDATLVLQEAYNRWGWEWRLPPGIFLIQSVIDA
jgi:hypothetical protein